MDFSAVHGVDLQHITHGSACFDLLVPLEPARWGVSQCTLGVWTHPAFGLIVAVCDLYEQVSFIVEHLVPYIRL